MKKNQLFVKSSINRMKSVLGKQRLRRKSEREAKKQQQTILNEIEYQFILSALNLYVHRMENNTTRVFFLSILEIVEIKLTLTRSFSPFMCVQVFSLCHCSSLFVCSVCVITEEKEKSVPKSHSKSLSKRR